MSTQVAIDLIDADHVVLPVLSNDPQVISRSKGNVSMPHGVETMPSLEMFASSSGPFRGG